ncbi:T9SS type A sorting domain-containing protein [Neolewinella aurantiaca]|uniref:T9SS type A sorting domain-containing protein n=1 Tax=Neolewinella aurantiaca TaxID=2602767 RepID=A0A5C7FGY7_9BACT|nr:T9SS type A sorting domain-containing protein [Neolewinella aurantiaca]TXF84033.1 T9SS type A sorting domain-containing protein [Neolewinella aurantiaca]
MKTIIFTVLTLSSALLVAQSVELTPAYPPVLHNGAELSLAWFGGLNTPQPQAADLDGDGTDDLYFFDKSGEINLALKGDGNGNYEVAPELVAHFPDDTEGWTMLRDFDQDGTPDMFRYFSAIDGVQVLRGTRRADGLLEFEVIDFGGLFPILYFPFEGNETSIFVSSIDYPAVEDLDFDGDLDLITFSVNGGYVEYYKNQSVERGFGLDTLIYTLESQCWGGFFESGLTTALDLAPAPGDCFDNLLPGGGGRPRHSGSTVTVFDYDGNGLMDVMLGDISFDRLVLGLNNGSVDQAWISRQDTAWNDEGVIADIASFPAAYYIDIDQDGKRDIIGSPSVTLNGTDVEVMWYYRNAGTETAPDFVFQSRKVLVEDMIDLGTSANVTTFDYDADGRPDLILGNNDEYTPDNSLDSRFRLLRNVTPEGGEIAFELVDEDYLGMSAFQSTGWAFTPTFGDLDGDGDLDVVIGDRSGKLFYGENTAGPGNEATFGQLVFEWQGLDAGQFSKPFIADLDRDGLQDLLVGGFDGRVRFFRNIGTEQSPMFNPDVSAAGNMLQLGGINTNSPGISTGHPAPWVVQNPNYTLVFAGNRIGQVEVYRFGIDSAYTEPFTLLTKEIAGLDVGGFANPGFGDFDGDGKLELVVGTQRGGVNFFRTNLNSDATTALFSAPSPSFAFSAAPNPASDFVTIDGWPTGAVSEISLLDVNGRVLRTETVAARTQVQWNVEGLSPGVYLVRLEGAGGLASQKIVIR